jgi:hypothetical protein
MATKSNKKQVSDKVIKLINEETNNIQEAITYLNQNKHVKFNDFLNYMEPSDKNERLFEVIVKSFGAESLTSVITKLKNNDEVMKMKKFLDSELIQNESQEIKDKLTKELLKKYKDTGTNHSFFVKFSSFIDSLDNKFLHNEVKKEYGDDSSSYLNDYHVISLVSSAINKYQNNSNKNEGIFILSDICNSIFNKVAEIDKELPTKFLSENIIKPSQFTNILYSTSLEDLQYFIDSNKKFLDEELINTIKSNSILKKLYYSEDLSAQTYYDSIKLIDNKKFNPSLSYFSNVQDQDILNGIKLPKFNTKKFSLYLEIIKTNKLSNNFNTIKEEDAYSDRKYSSTAFENFLNNGIKDISNIAYDNALSESNASLSKIKNLTQPSANLIKEKLLETAENFLSNAKQLISLGFEPVVINSSISQITQKFIDQLQGENISIKINKMDDFEYHRNRNFDKFRYVAEDLARELKVDPHKLMVLSDLLESLIPKMQSEKNEEKEQSVPLLNESFKDKEEALLSNWNKFMEQVTRLTPEEKETRKMKM